MLAEQVQCEGSYVEVRQKTLQQHLTEEIVCEVACVSEGTQGKIHAVAASALWLFLRSLIPFTSDRKDQMILSVRSNLGVTQRTRQTKLKYLDEAKLRSSSKRCTVHGSQKQEGMRSGAGMVAGGYCHSVLRVSFSHWQGSDIIVLCDGLFKKKHSVHRKRRKGSQ